MTLAFPSFICSIPLGWLGLMFGWPELARVDASDRPLSGSFRVGLRLGVKPVRRFGASFCVHHLRSDSRTGESSVFGLLSPGLILHAD